MALNLEQHKGKNLRRGISVADADVYDKYFGDRARELQAWSRFDPVGGGQWGKLIGGITQDERDRLNNIEAVKSDAEKKYNASNKSIYADAQDTAQYGSEDVDTKAQEIQKASQANADKITGQAAEFRSNLPNYINQQTDPMVDQSKRKLVNDIQDIKQNSNSRGLLYSGVNEGNQAAAKGFESSQLAKGIQGVNTQANDQADYRDQLAANAQAGAAGQEMQLLNYQATQSQTAYEQALKRTQAEQAFWGGLFGSLGSAAGMVGGAAAGKAVVAAI